MKTKPLRVRLIAAIVSVAMMSQSEAQIVVGGDGANTVDSTSYSGAQSLTKVGSNTVTLTGANSYTGATNVNDGTLMIGANNVLPDTSPVVVNAGAIFSTGSFGDYIGSLSLTGNASVAGTGGFILTQGASGTASLKTATATGTNNLIASNIGISSSHGGVGGNSTLRFDVQGPSDTLRITGVIADKSFDGGGSATSGAISKIGNGTLTLSGSNTYTGETFINAGTVVADNNRALGAGGVFDATKTTVAAGATLALQGTISMDEHMHIFGSGVGGLGAIRNLSGSNALTASGYALRSDVTVGADDGQLTIAGAIGQQGGVYGVTKVGAGTLVLGGVNTWSGGTRVDAGGLFIGAGGTLLNTGSALTVNNGATVTFARQDVLGFHTATITMPIVLNNGGLLQNSGTFFNTLGALTLNGGTLQANAVQPASGQSFALKGTVTVAGTSTSTITGNGIALGAGSVTATTFNVADGTAATDLLVAGVLRDGSGATFGPTQISSFTKTGAGVMVLTGSNTYTGTTTISDGTLQVGDGGTSGNFGTGNVVNNAALVFNRAGSLTVGNTISGSGTLEMTGPGTVTLSAANSYTGLTTVSQGTLATSGSNRIATGNSVTVNAGGTLALGGDQTLASVAGSGSIDLGSSTLTTGSSTSTFGGIITGNGGLTKTDAGTFTLSGANTYVGDTVLSGGTLVLANANALWSGGVLSMDAGTTLTVNQRTFIGALDQNGGTIDGPGELVATLTLTESGALDAVLADGPDFAAGILKRTAGTTTVGAANTFTGAVNVQGGTLQLAAGGSFAAASSLALASGATMDLAGRSQTFSAVQGAGGTVSLGAGQLTVNNAVAGVFGGQITGSGGLVKQGAGRFELTSSQGYTGTTTVAAGELAVNGSLASSLVSVLAGGTLSGTGTLGGNATIAGNHSPGNSPGIQTVAGDLTYSGGSSLTWELIANTADLASRGTDFDGIDVGGDLAFSGATAVNLVFDLGESVVDWNDDFWSLDRTGADGWLIYDTVGTTLGLVNLTVAGSPWLDSLGNELASIRPNASFGFEQVGSDVYLTFAAVPEPSSVVLMGLGSVIACLALRRRQRGTSKG